jgi:hypothetical protein
VCGADDQRDAPGDGASDPPCHASRDNDDKQGGAGAVGYAPVQRVVHEIEIGKHGDGQARDRERSIPVWRARGLGRAGGPPHGKTGEGMANRARHRSAHDGRFCDPLHVGRKFTTAASC